MNALDIFFIIVIGFFLIRGLFRGLVTEAGAILGVVGGFLIANAYYEKAEEYIKVLLPDSSWIGVISYVAVFLGIIILTSLAAALLHKLIGASPVAWLDHAIGLLLGGLKGVLICCVLLACVLFFLPDAEVLRTSRIAPYLQLVTDALLRLMPARA